MEEDSGGLDDDFESEIYEMMSADNIVFELTYKQLSLSKYFVCISQCDCSFTRFQMRLSTKILQQIVKYLKYHNGKKPSFIHDHNIYKTMYKKLCHILFSAKLRVLSHCIYCTC